MDTRKRVRALAGPAFRAASAAIILSIAPVADRASCAPPPASVDYRAEMRSFVERLSFWAKSLKPGFIVIPQNGQDLAAGGRSAPDAAYLAAIDGQGREGLFYGATADDAATPAAMAGEWMPFLELERGRGKTILVTDYCSTRSHVDAAIAKCAAKGFLSFPADSRLLDRVPGYPKSPPGLSAADVASLAQARNFLYLIDPDYADKGAYLAALAATNHDLLVLDLFDMEGEALAAGDLAAIKRKANGGKRLAICYLSIGEAEDYRYYWRPAWSSEKPAWLEAENPDWAGNYKVRYWDGDWQAIIYGNAASYLKKIIDAGFDGAYLDIVDAFEYWESK